MSKFLTVPFSTKISHFLKKKYKNRDTSYPQPFDLWLRGNFSEVQSPVETQQIYRPALGEEFSYQRSRNPPQLTVVLFVTQVHDSNFEWHKSYRGFIMAFSRTQSKP